MKRRGGRKCDCGSQGLMCLSGFFPLLSRCPIPVKTCKKKFLSHVTIMQHSKRKLESRFNANEQRERKCYLNLYLTAAPDDPALCSAGGDWRMSWKGLSLHFADIVSVNVKEFCMLQVWYASNYLQTSSNPSQQSQPWAEKGNIKTKEHAVIMVPNSLTHIILVSFRMQKRTKHTIQNTKCINSPHPTPVQWHTPTDASWNTENQDIREAAEQSAQRGQSCAWWEDSTGCDLMSCQNLHSSHHAPPTYKQMEF